MRRYRNLFLLVPTLTLFTLAGMETTSPRLLAQEKKPVIPHAQDKPPNEPRDPQTAAKMMTVPEGFSVEVVAAEPDIVNPVAMTIDERGRFWITESLEYPRRDAGPGKDRVKILEDTDGDGKCDKFTVFLDGLNIPSGVAVGHGGVWIANSPDILFVPDADRDGVPDGPARVVVTGFGRTDTHELPNSLTWGPDGWLYGLNGVFNFSKVTYPKDSPWLKHVAESLRDSDSKTPSTPDEKSDSQPKANANASRGATRLQTEFTFTCAMFRIHPRTWEFQIFAEGTSNPWGIAFNDEGEAFVSACVIDHLWHIVETGYYHRQGGPYPPFTWKIDSIVKHKHQKAAYCGIHYFDSDAYPEQYRKKLYMGNIHGGCINVDKLQRDGSTYFATGEPDFLTANDAWFMPVVQKTGPDGCLYILDWYDRYHCYQDANRDPAGIDRLKGRLYRVRYGSHARQSVGEDKKTSESKPNATPPRSGERGYEGGRAYPQIDLAKETDEQLIERLGANNDFIRWTATRLLQERATDSLGTALLSRFVREGASPVFRRHALFALGGIEVGKTGDSHLKAFSDPTIQAWRTRVYYSNPSNLHSPAERSKMSFWSHREWASYWSDHWSRFPVSENPAIRLQQLIGISKIPSEIGPIEGLLKILAKSEGDRLIPQIVWQNLHSRLELVAADFVEVVAKNDYLKSKPVADLMPRVVDRILGRQKFDAAPVAKLFALLRDDHPQVGREVLGVLAAKVQSGELKGDKLEQLKTAMSEPLTPLLRSSGGSPESHPLGSDAALLAVSWGDPRGLPHVRLSFTTRGLQPDLRLKALNALIAAKDEGLLELVAKALDEASQISNPKSQISDSNAANLKSEILNLKSQLMTALAKLDDPKVADVVLSRYAKLEPELQPAAVELLTQRASWSKSLLSQVGEKKIAATAINVNQARRIQTLKDKDLSELLNRHWGQVRDARNPDREKVVAEMKALIRNSKGDPFAGEKVFKRVCAACHKIYGEGPDIGPDITSNGRNDFNQLLSNVFDPSLVIGAGYRVCTVVNKAGRVQSGLLVEDSPQRVVLKPAAVASRLGLRPDPAGDDGEKKKAVGTESQPTEPVTVTVGQLQIIPRDDIDEFKINELSLMPEGLEKQLTQQEIVDLFAFLVLDKHPNDKSAKRLPGVSAITPRQSTNPADFQSLVAEVLPGFSTNASGEGGVALMSEYWQRENVLRTHPVSRDVPCVLTRTMKLPEGLRTRMFLDVCPQENFKGDWRLVVRGNGERLYDEIIGANPCCWQTVVVDLSKFAGKDVKIDLVNQANDWNYEFAYWQRVEFVSDPLLSRSNREVDPTGRTKFEVAEGKARLLDIATGKAILNLNNPKFLTVHPEDLGPRRSQPFNAPIHCWAFSPDGKALAVGGGENAPLGLGSPVNYGEFFVFDTTTGVALPSKTQSTSAPTASDRQGQRITWFGDYELRCVNADGKGTPQGFGRVRSVAFESDKIFIELESAKGLVRKAAPIDGK